jgi:two-component system, LytTR family, response regulator
VERRDVKVVIVDDEPLARQVVRILLENDRELTVAGECNGVDAPEVILRERPDILFLDIQMPEVDGFDVLERVGPDTVPAVVFVTAYDEYALRAFEVHALDYLLKPFDDRRFFTALSRAKEQVRTARQSAKPASSFTRRFLVRAREKVLFIKADDLEWVEAADYYVSLHAGGKSYLLRQTMAEIERQLDPARFVRVHRSAIVNLDRVKEMHPLFRGDCALVLADGTQLRLSRARREEFERRLAGV